MLRDGAEGRNIRKQQTAGCIWRFGEISRCFQPKYDLFLNLTRPQSLPRAKTEHCIVIKCILIKVYSKYTPLQCAKNKYMTSAMVRMYVVYF